MPIKRHSNRRKQKARADKARGTARERGYTTHWDKFAYSYLIANPLCVYCKTKGRISEATLVDHITPHRQGSFWPDIGTPTDEFFAACCRECHNGPKQRAEALSDKTGKDVRLILIQWGMLPKGFAGL